MTNVHILTNTLYHIYYFVLLRTFPFSVSTEPIWACVSVIASQSHADFAVAPVLIINAVPAPDNRFLLFQQGDGV